MNLTPRFTHVVIKTLNFVICPDRVGSLGLSETECSTISSRQLFIIICSEVFIVVLKNIFGVCRKATSVYIYRQINMSVRN